MKKYKKKFRKYGLLLVAYLPVSLIIWQMLCNILFFIDKGAYAKYGLEMATWFGNNIWVSIHLIMLTHFLKFCSVSKACAWAQVAYGVFFLFYGLDDVFNICVQLAIGIIALIITFRDYIKRFPLCRMSLYIGFIGSVIKNGSCEKGMKDWERNVENIILKQKRHVQ